ncbi:MAG: hypothetical protein GC206_17110 [Alphaproteobacteria bacterium]|nr:hypothetical protein [Alphaproteobacteria bacterium]
MSVLNIAYRETDVLFGSDTMVYGALGNPLRLCDRKVEVATGGTFMWSTRGRVDTGDRFDAIAAGLSTVDDAEAAAHDFVNALDDDDCDGGGIEVTVGGWSDRRGDLVVHQAKRRGSVIWEPRDFVRGTYLAPTCGNLALPRLVTERQFIALAMAQGRIRDQFEASMCVGGTLHITTATREGCHQRLAAVFESYDRDVAELGFDPNSEAVAVLRAGREAVAA